MYSITPGFLPHIKLYKNKAGSIMDIDKAGQGYPAQSPLRSSQKNWEEEGNIFSTKIVGDSARRIAK